MALLVFSVGILADWVQSCLSAGRGGTGQGVGGTLDVQWRIVGPLFETMTCSMEGTSELGGNGMKHREKTSQASQGMSDSFNTYRGGHPKTRRAS